MRKRSWPGIIVASARVAAVVVLTGAFAPAIRADDIGPLDRLRVGVGVDRLRNDIDIRYDRTGLRGSEVDFQRDLGVDTDKLSFSFEVATTLAERHQFKLTGVRYQDEAARLLDASLSIGDADFPAAAALRADVDLRIQEGSYTWFFRQDAKTAFGLGLGGLRYTLRSTLAADFEIDDVPGTAAVAINESAWAPLLRAEYQQVLGRRWRWGLEAAYVRKPSGSVSGDAIAAAVSLDWLFATRFGLGLRYRYDQVDLEFDRSSYQGTLRVRNHGPQLLAMLRF